MRADVDELTTAIGFMKDDMLKMYNRREAEQSQNIFKAN